MRNYKVELVLTGGLTQLPDSQKLFGALVYMFSEKYGSAKTSKLVKSVFDKKTHFALSNVMPLDYLPTPKDYLLARLADNSTPVVDLKIKRAAIKDRDYVKLPELTQLIEDTANCENIFPYVKLQHWQQPRASIDSIRYDIPELDSNLYSVPTIVPQEVIWDKNNKIRKVAAKRFYFYLQVGDGYIGSDILCMLNTAKETNQAVVLGKRASQGLNIFELDSISEEGVLNAHCDHNLNYFLNMGMLLPNEIDFESSMLKLFTSIRQPFEMVGGWDKKYTKQYISFIDEGSIISAPAGFEKAGKSIVSPFNRKRDIVFGDAFLYPMPLCTKGI